MSQEYSIFKPKSSRSLFFDYPDLRKIEVFRTLNADDILFVWFYACEVSPHFDITKDRERTEKCIEDSYRRGGKNRISKKEEDMLMAGRFSEKIQAAINEMSKFKVGPRVEGLKMLEKGFENMIKILNINASDVSQFMNKDGEVDWSKKKAYVDTLKNATDLTPKLIGQLESRFHLTKEEKGKAGATFEGNNLLDEMHEMEE